MVTLWTYHLPTEGWCAVFSLTTIFFWILVALLAVLGFAIEAGKTRGLGRMVAGMLVLCLASILLLLAEKRPFEAAATPHAQAGKAALSVSNGSVTEPERSDPVGEVDVPPTYVTDCPTCPQLALVRTGAYTRTSEDLPRTIEVGAFALGRNEISRQEFATFVSETGHQVEPGCVTAGVYQPKADWLSPGIEQSGNHPVVCISIRDAKAFATWLSQKTGRAYRLPTEAEWEYAARAGERTDRPIRDSQLLLGLNFGMSRDGTFTTGIARPNRFGLVDMLGNAAEYVADCWTADPTQLPDNGRAFSIDEARCQTGVARGGDWRTPPRNMRFGKRELARPSHSTGFRIARDLTMEEIVRLEQNTGMAAILREASKPKDRSDR